MTMFGKENFGKNMAAIGIAPASSSFLIASLVAGQLYEMNADKDGYCTGNICFGLTYMMNFSLCMCSSVICLFFTRRLRKSENIVSPMVNV